MAPGVRRAVAPVALAVCGIALLVGGCSSARTTPTANPQKTVALAPGAAVPFELSHNARADVTTGACAETGPAGSWVLSGSVENPTKVTTSFRIVVDFVSNPGSTVLGTTEVDLSNIRPHQRLSWSAAGAKGQTHVACIVRQVETV